MRGQWHVCYGSRLSIIIITSLSTQPDFSSDSVCGNPIYTLSEGVQDFHRLSQVVTNDTEQMSQWHAIVEI